MLKETSTSSCLLSSAHFHPLLLLSSRRKKTPLCAGAGLPWRAFGGRPYDIHTVCTCSDSAFSPSGRRSLRARNEGFFDRIEQGFRSGRFCIGGVLFGTEGCDSRQLSSKQGRCVRTRAFFNPRSGGDGGGGPGRAILNLAGAGLLTYLTVTGRLDWLFDTILALWLFLAVSWWLLQRSLVRGPCPNCGGEFQVFEFTLQEEYRLCPYCSQPFKLENKRFVRDEPRFTNQQGRGFKPPFGGFGGFEEFGRSSSSRKKEDSSGVIVDVEAEVRDKD